MSVNFISELWQWYPTLSARLPLQGNLPTRWWHLCLHEGTHVHIHVHVLVHVYVHVYAIPTQQLRVATCQWTLSL